MHKNFSSDFFEHFEMTLLLNRDMKLIPEVEICFWSTGSYDTLRTLGQIFRFKDKIH